MSMIDEAFGCVNNTIRLRSGLYFDLANPKPDQFTFQDIAGALSKICRFGGQCEWFYSVAEHCFHCSQVAKADGASIEIQRACLLHDAAEAFCGDVVKPLKVMLGDYGAIEKRIEAVIAEKYGVRFDAPEVREIDWAMLIAERRYLFSSDGVVWTGENQVRVINREFKKWDHIDAEAMFAVRAMQLGIDTNDYQDHAPWSRKVAR